MTHFKSPLHEIKSMLDSLSPCYVRMEPHGRSHKVLGVGEGWIKVEPVDVSDLADGNMPFWLNLSVIREIGVRRNP